MRYDPLNPDAQPEPAAQAPAPASKKRTRKTLPRSSSATARVQPGDRQPSAPFNGPSGTDTASPAKMASAARTAIDPVPDATLLAMAGFAGVPAIDAAELRTRFTLWIRATQNPPADWRAQFAQFLKAQKFIADSTDQKPAAPSDNLGAASHCSSTDTITVDHGPNGPSGTDSEIVTIQFPGLQDPATHDHNKWLQRRRQFRSLTRN